jgi:CheY-like chemotaxis protein
MVLSELGLICLVATDGESALETARAYNPEIVLLDYRMPGMNGVELARRLRAKASSDAPIVLVTAGRNFNAEARGAGVTACLEKPFNIEDLYRIVLECISNRGRLSA